jgi:hypothetical protein
MYFMYCDFYLLHVAKDLHVEKRESDYCNARFKYLISRKKKIVPSTKRLVRKVHQAFPRPRAIPGPWKFFSRSLTLLRRPAMPDTLSLRELSMLRRMLLELLLRRARRASSGSCGCKPLARANKFRISVRLMTPLIRPDRLDPVMADAEMAGTTAPVPRWVGTVELTGMGPACVCGRGVIGDGGTRVAGVSAGVDGPEDEGDGLSTTHMRCERVATSFATVWASVLYGFIWKTGNESLPSLTPRSERMTEMK